MPATISMMPTTCMKADGLIGIRFANAGARYRSQWTRMFVNLSRPATIGTRPNTIFKVQ